MSADVSDIETATQPRGHERLEKEPSSTKYERSSETRRSISIVKWFGNKSVNSAVVEWNLKGLELLVLCILRPP